MNRAGLRKIIEYAKKNELHKPENREALETALEGCRPGVTRAKLRAAIMRKP